MRLTTNGIGDVPLTNRRVSALLGKKIGMSWVVISIMISVAVSYAVASTINVSSTTYQQILGGYSTVNSSVAVSCPSVISSRYVGGVTVYSLGAFVK